MEIKTYTDKLGISYNIKLVKTTTWQYFINDKYFKGSFPTKSSAFQYAVNSLS